MILLERNAIHPRRLEGNPGSWRDSATVEGFIIESWSQGFMVGALLIMACVTISNMRAGIFLHKLILLEVRQEQSLCIRMLTILIALPCYVPRDLLLYELRRIRMVSIFDRCPALSLLAGSQLDCLVEDSTVLDNNSE